MLNEHCAHLSYKRYVSEGNENVVQRPETSGLQWMKKGTYLVPDLQCNKSSENKDSICSTELRSREEVDGALAWQGVWSLPVSFSRTEVFSEHRTPLPSKASLFITRVRMLCTAQLQRYLSCKLLFMISDLTCTPADFHRN